MSVPEPSFSDPKRQQVEETPELSRARKTLAAYYIGLPFAIIYAFQSLSAESVAHGYEATRSTVKPA